MSGSVRLAQQAPPEAGSAGWQGPVYLGLGSNLGDRAALLRAALGRLAIAFASGRFVATLLFGLPPTDPMSIALAVAVMLLVSAVAGYLPARRASRVDPMVALHYE